jgi:hypothetical protein
MPKGFESGVKLGVYKMAYCINNHILKDKVYYLPEWTIVGPGHICIRDAYAQKEKIKICKNPEEETFSEEKVYVTIPKIIAKIQTSPKIEKRLFTHYGPEMYDECPLEWRIQGEKYKIYAFKAKMVGWILWRLRGERLKWHLVPWGNNQGILVFTDAVDFKNVYAMITCHYSS